MKKIYNLTPDVTVVMPGSKSITHRAFIAAGLASGQSILTNFLRSEDTLYTASGLRKLGVNIEFTGDDAVVYGTGGKIAPSSGTKKLFVGNSGTSLRLLTSLTALGHGKYILTGTSRMCERPIGELLEGLNALGVRASCMDRSGFPPVLMEADGLKGGRITLSGGVSSQYLSSILLAAPYSRRGIEVEMKGDLVSRPYVDLTLQVMESFGVKVSREGYKNFSVKAGQGYCSTCLPVEGDASAASYFWAAAAVTGLKICTTNIVPLLTRQGDIQFLDVLEQMGCAVIREKDRVTVQGGNLRAVDLDMSYMPDMVPTVAALALFAEGETQIRNVAHLRHKESDRLQVIALEWNKIGARVRELPDGLVLRGCQSLAGAELAPHNDHRIAMALAVAALRVPGVIIQDKACVNKSFPEFWSLWKNISDRC